MHPLHLGVLHVDVNESGQTSVQIRLFTDDLENGLYHTFGEKVSIVPGKSEIEKKVRQYINQKFIIEQDGSSLNMDFKSLTKDKDVTELRYSLNVSGEKTLHICCNVFFELFRDQTNLLIVNFDGKEDGFRLTPNKECVNVEK